MLNYVINTIEAGTKDRGSISIVTLKKAMRNLTVTEIKHIAERYGVIGDYSLNKTVDLIVQKTIEEKVKTG